VFNRIWGVFASVLHVEIVETIVQSTTSKHWGIFVVICGSSFASPLGITHFLKHTPKTKNIDG